MLNQFSRTQLQFGAEGMEKLYHARVSHCAHGSTSLKKPPSLYAGREFVCFPGLYYFQNK